MLAKFDSKLSKKVVDSVGALCYYKSLVYRIRTDGMYLVN